MTVSLNSTRLGSEFPNGHCGSARTMSFVDMRVRNYGLKPEDLDM